MPYHKIFCNGQAITELIVPNGITFLSTSILSCAIGIKRVVISDTVVRLGKFVLSYCPDLEEVVLGKNVRILSQSAMYACDKLKRVVIDTNLIRIDGNVLKYESTPPQILYKGTLQEWEKIEIDTKTSASLHSPFDESNTNIYFFKGWADFHEHSNLNLQYPGDKKYWFYSENNNFMIICEEGRIISKHLTIASNGDLIVSNLQLIGSIAANSLFSSGLISAPEIGVQGVKALQVNEGQLYFYNLSTSEDYSMSSDWAGKIYAFTDGNMNNNQGLAFVSDRIHFTNKSSKGQCKIDIGEKLENEGNNTNRPSVTYYGNNNQAFQIWPAKVSSGIPVELYQGLKVEGTTTLSGNIEFDGDTLSVKKSSSNKSSPGVTGTVTLYAHSGFNQDGYAITLTFINGICTAGSVRKNGTDNSSSNLSELA